MKTEYQILKRDDQFCSSEEDFESFLNSNFNYKIDKTKKLLKYNECQYKYQIKCEEVKEEKEIFFIISFENDNVTELEKLDKNFLNFIRGFKDIFCVNMLVDNISEYYTSSLYKKINNIERTLRKIIYYFMGKNVGRKWVKKCIPNNEIKDKSKTQSDNNDIEEDVNDFLMNADFIQLVRFLFEKYPKRKNQNELIEELRKADEEKINKLINEYEYKSNFERYFTVNINASKLEENLKKIYKCRNSVAHYKKMRKEEFDEAIKIIKETSKDLEKCIEEIDKSRVPDEEKETLSNIGGIMLNSYVNLGTNISRPIFTDLIDNIKKPYIDLSNLNTNNYLNDVGKSFIEDLSNLNDIFNSKDSEDFKDFDDSKESGNSEDSND